MGPQARRWRQGDRARSILVGALVCLALIVAERAQAQNSPRKYAIDISQQALTPALRQLSMQTGVLYGYSPESAAEEAMLVGPVRGQYTIDEALGLLLQQTGLTFSWVDSKNVAIVRAPPAPKVESQPPKPPRPEAERARSRGDATSANARGRHHRRGHHVGCEIPRGQRVIATRPGDRSQTH